MCVPDIVTGEIVSLSSSDTRSKVHAVDFAPAMSSELEARAKTDNCVSIKAMVKNAEQVGLSR